MRMKDLYKIVLIIAVAFLWHSCGNSDSEVMPTVRPDATGTMTDVRDGYAYHWVRYGGLDWTVENSHYNTGDDQCLVYSVSGIVGGYGDVDSTLLKKYGYLYTYSGALEAAPDGWRIPTDDDWKKLEKALGMSGSEADALYWRGSYAATLMVQDSTGTDLNFIYGGFHTAANYSYGSSFQLKSAFGFYWTSTKDTTNEGTAFYRKIEYNSSKVFRYRSIYANMYSARFVRDAQSDK